LQHPAHIDGRSVVVLRQDRWGFRVPESGILNYDEQTLSLGEGVSRRDFWDAELQSLMPVAAGRRIPECRGLDFPLLSGADA